jgi:hypothetical protein
MYCWNGPSPIGHGLPGPAHGAFWPEVKQGWPSPSSASATCGWNPADRWPVGGGGVPREKADRVVDRFGGWREGRAYQSGGFHGGANWVMWSDGGGAEEQPRALARSSRELPASVWTSGWCREVWRGTGAAVHDGSTMASMAAIGGGGGKGCSTGTGAPFITVGGGWQMAAWVAARGGSAVTKPGVVEWR